MSNEMDLHSATVVHKSGRGRVLANLYFVLTVLFLIAWLGMTAGPWKTIVLLVVLAIAFVPPLVAFRGRRKLRKIREVQLMQFRDKVD